MPLYDFECPECGVFEALAKASEEEMECACGASAHRLFPLAVAFKVHEGPGNWNVKTADGKYRLRDFNEAQHEHHARYDEIEKREGVRVERPNLLKEGLAKAKRMGAKIDF